MKVYVLLAPGFEIVEAMLPIDILRRTGVEVKTVATDQQTVTSSNGTSVVADQLLSNSDLSDGTMLFLPGGMPGSKNLQQNQVLAEIIRNYHSQDKWLVAVCAAPMVYGMMGILQGEKATCYPGFEKDLLGADFQIKTCVRSGHFITGCGAGACYELGREMAAVLVGEETANDVLRKMMYHVYE